MTKKEFVEPAVSLISDDPKLAGMRLPESSAKVVKEHVLGSGKKSMDELKMVLIKILHLLRAKTKRDVSRKTLELTGLSVLPKPPPDQTTYTVKCIVAHDYTKDGHEATMRWQDTYELMRTLPTSVVRAYSHKCIGPGSAFERKYILAEAEEAN